MQARELNRRLQGGERKLLKVSQDEGKKTGGTKRESTGA